MQENILLLSDALLSAREAKKNAEAALKDMTAIIDDLETQLIALMVDDELTSFKRDGVLFSLVNKSHISAEAERKDDLWEQMKKQG